jgi:hypothetical protein
MPRTARSRGIASGSARAPPSNPRKLAAPVACAFDKPCWPVADVFAEVETPSRTSKLVGNELVSIASVPPPNCPGSSAE